MLTYCTPNPELSIANIEKTKGSEIEIIKSNSGFSKVDFDLSVIPSGPPNSVFAGIVEFGKLLGSKKYPPQFNLIGSQEKEVFINEAEYIVADIKNNLTKKSS